MNGSLTARINELRIPARLAELEQNTVVQYLALVSITLLAVALRFVKLGAWSFWIDEVYEINYALQAVRDLSALTRPSLLLTGAALSYLGVNEWTGRLAPALVGIISIPILYFPIRKMFSSSVAILAVFFLALSPWHLFWSQNTRFYTTLLLFYTLGQVFFFFWLESPRVSYLLISGLFLLLSFLERDMAAFFAPVVGVYLAALWIFRLGKPAALQWRVLILPGILVCAAGLFIALGTNAVSSFFENFVGHRQNPARVLLGTIYDIGLPMFLLACFAGVYVFLQKSRPGIFMFVGAVVPLFILILISPFTQAFSRYVFMTLPNWLILGAIGARELIVHTQKHGKVLAIGVLLLLVADAVSQQVLYYGYQNGNREDYRAAYLQVKEQRSPGEMVVTGWLELGEYYVGEDVVWDRDVGLEDILQSGQRVWLVVDNRSGFSTELQSWAEQNAQLVGVHDIYLSGKLLMVRVYLYDPSRS
jgi:uncharacterized membrane protein